MEGVTPTPIFTNKNTYSTTAEKNGARSLFQLGVLLIQTELFTMNDK
jgi:hypothetical protein